MKSLKHTLHILGPGLLYAGAAIGVSHLVQSTRAGADFGMQLIWAVVLANLLKYPFFEIGPRYTAVTGKSLLEGYKRLGNWALILFLLITLGTMFTIQAAVTIVTAGLANQLFSTDFDPRWISVVLLFICSAILIVGHYSFLDKLIKFIIVLLAVTTIACVCGALSAPPVPKTAPVFFSWDNNQHIFFLIALIGWMPAPLDISVWHSMWCMAKNKVEDKKLTLKDSLLDFNIGYIGTAVLAICFVTLGSVVMYRSGVEFSSSATEFSSQLIGLYTKSLGPWSFAIIVTAAFTTMFSTTLTCLDAFPRVLRATAFELNSKMKNQESRRAYNLCLLFTVIGAICVLFLFLKNMKGLVDLATTISFLVAPIFAILNYMVIHGSDVPVANRPGPILNALAFLGFLFLTLFGLYFVSLKYF